eukprot:XP_017946072.1 PREDICTED: uncharacterized protein LOC108645395 isoform X2 [Xenopus tropicalis]
MNKKARCYGAGTQGVASGSQGKKMVAPQCHALVHRVLAECPVTKARACEFRLPHGPVKTPVFMPVGTQGTMGDGRSAAESGLRDLPGEHLSPRDAPGSGDHEKGGRPAWFYELGQKPPYSVGAPVRRRETTVSPDNVIEDKAAMKEYINRRLAIFQKIRENLLKKLRKITTTTPDYVVVDKEEILRAMHSRKMHRFDRTTTESPKIETTVDYVVVDKEEILRAMRSRKMHRFHRTSKVSILYQGN